MHDVRTYIYILVYKKHIPVYIYIVYIYDEYFSPLYDNCGARAARQLYIIIYNYIYIVIYNYIICRPGRDTTCQGKGKFGKLGGEKSCIVVYGSARSSECEAHGPSATATI